MNESNFEGADMESTRFNGATISHSVFDNAVANQAKFIDAVSPDVSFRNVSLRNSDFGKASLRNSTFSGSNITEANFIDAETYHADIRDVAANHNTKFGNTCIYEKKANRTVDKEDWFGTSIESLCVPFLDDFIRWVRRLKGDINDRSDLEQAVDVYRTYQRIFRQNSVPTKVRDYEIRERESRRKIHLSAGNLRKWFWFATSKRIFLYSHSPRNPLYFSLFTIIVFSLLFLLIGVEWGGSMYSVCWCFDLSGSVSSAVIALTASFRAFLPGPAPEITLKGGTDLLITIESAIGTFAVSLFVVTLVQRAKH